MATSTGTPPGRAPFAGRYSTIGVPNSSHASSLSCRRRTSGRPAGKICCCGCGTRAARLPSGYSSRRQNSSRNSTDKQCYAVSRRFRCLQRGQRKVMESTATLCTHKSFDADEMPSSASTSGTAGDFDVAEESCDEALRRAFTQCRHTR